MDRCIFLSIHGHNLTFSETTLIENSEGKCSYIRIYILKPNEKKHDALHGIPV